jgi:hypothetical protein
VVFSCPEPGRYFGFRLAGAAHKEGPNSRVMGTAHATDARSAEGSARYTCEPEPHQCLGGQGGSSPRTSRAPEGGGTTQRGDPAPGPMRCGTTASGEERMHP